MTPVVGEGDNRVTGLLAARNRIVTARSFPDPLAVPDLAPDQLRHPPSLGEIFRYQLYVVDAPDGTLVVVSEVTEADVDTFFPYWEEVVASIEFAPVTP